MSYGPGTAGTVSFSIKNSANGYEFQCLQGNRQRARQANHFLHKGKLWYSCNTFCFGAEWYYPPEDNPPLNTTFHYDVDTKTLSIDQKWSCGSGWNATLS
jgi:hypothetical protein